MTEEQRHAAERCRDMLDGPASHDWENASVACVEDLAVLARAYLELLSASSPDTVEARAVLEKMTPGEWTRGRKDATKLFAGPERLVAECHERNTNPALDVGHRAALDNATGIVYLRNYAAAWLDEIDRLRAEKERPNAMPVEVREWADRFVMTVEKYHVPVDADTCSPRLMPVARYLCSLSKQSTDDAEPVTEEWLRSVGFDVLPKDSFEMARKMFGKDMYAGCVEVRRDRRVLLSGVHLPHIKTRSHVRQLCSVLGIQLREKRKDGAAVAIAFRAFLAEVERRKTSL